MQIAIACVMTGAVTFAAAPEIKAMWLMTTMTPEEIAEIGQSVYYTNCDDARSAGAAPIRRGQPGYREGMDGDDDGIACEPYR